MEHSMWTLFLACFATTIGQVSSSNCPSGWLVNEESCYFFPHNMKVNFLQAEDFCRRKEAYLVRIETHEENVFMKDYLRGLTAEHHWIGLTDELTEHTWTWFGTDTPVTYSDWYPGEPNNSGNSDCAIYNRDMGYAWDDIPCANPAEPICEMSVGEIPAVG